MVKPDPRNMSLFVHVHLATGHATLVNTTSEHQRELLSIGRSGAMGSHKMHHLSRRKRIAARPLLPSR